jgi:replicative DNA helicase
MITELTKINIENKEQIFLNKYPFYTTQRGGIHFIGALPGHGKTQLLLNLMSEISKIRTIDGKPAYHCLFVSLEMTASAIKDRYMKIDPENWKKYLESRDKNVHINEFTSASVEDMIKTISAYEEDLANPPLDAIFIDYVQLFEATSSNEHEANSEALRV